MGQSLSDAPLIFPVSLVVPTRLGAGPVASGNPWVFSSELEMRSQGTDLVIEVTVFGFPARAAHSLEILEIYKQDRPRLFGSQGWQTAFVSLSLLVVTCSDYNYNAKRLLFGSSLAF